MQFSQPTFVVRMIWLHSRVKLLGLVRGLPSGEVMRDATPVARAKLSWIFWIS
jgi:hypothetical protein